MNVQEKCLNKVTEIKYVIFMSDLMINHNNNQQINQLFKTIVSAALEEGI